MGIPQIIFLVLIAGSGVLNALCHGQERHDTHYNFLTFLLNAGITVGLVTWGGFFN